MAYQSCDTKDSVQEVRLTRSVLWKLAAIGILPALTIGSTIGVPLIGYVWGANERLVRVEMNQIALTAALTELTGAVKEHVREPTHPGSVSKADIADVKADIAQVRRELGAMQRLMLERRSQP